MSYDATDYQPSDIVAWDLTSGIDHIGIVTNMLSDSEDRCLIVHNISAPAHGSKTCCLTGRSRDITASFNHAHMFRLILLFQLAFIALCGGHSEVDAQEETRHAIDREEYLVYSALIDQRHSQPKNKRLFTLQGVIAAERYVIDRVTLVVVISQSLSSFDHKTMTFENLRSVLAGKMPGTVENTFSDFVRKNSRSYSWSNNFSAGIKTVLISERERQLYWTDNMGRADAFFRQYPGSQGLLAFSRVGFNSRKDQALVYVEAQEDFDSELRPLWTWSTYFALLTKVKGVWVIGHVYYPNRTEQNPTPLTIDLKRCAALDRSMAWGLGSETIGVKGLDKGRCVLQHYTEVEGGYSRSECRVPINLGEVSIYWGGTSFYYSRDLSKHCKVIKMGNIFFDRLKP